MNVAAEPALKRGVTGPGYFALAFGTIVGSAWMVLMGWSPAAILARRDTAGAAA